MSTDWLEWQAEAEQHARENPFIDWAAFWAREHSEQEWIVDRVLAKGRGHVIYAQKKVGKSLVVLALLLELLLERLDVIVVYLDWEMTEDDLYERLVEMGHDEDSDLSRLRYWQLPNIGPLDTSQGAAEALEIIDLERDRWAGHHIVVVLDTTSRAVRGPENDADTFRAFYRFTGIQLKQRGITYARIDHAGKSAEQGQRGSSAKGEDVDVIWRLEPADRGGYTLRREAARMGWVPERVGFERHYHPLRFTRSLELVPEGTADLMELLDKLDIPVETTNKAARQALKAAGEHARNAVLAAALKARKARLLGRGTPRGTHFSGIEGAASEEPGNALQTQGGTPRGTLGNGAGGERGTPPPLLVRGAVPTPFPNEEPDFPDWAYSDEAPFDPDEEPPE